MIKEIMFGLIGGLGIFIFGMKYLSDSLQKVAGTKLRRILRSLTQNRVRGALLGTAVTSIMQSSSITTVMLVGLLNAGIISLMQASSVVIGAALGTTITAQIIAFKVSEYALPAIGIGVLTMLVSRKKKTQFWGQVVLALGLVFLGLAIMSDVMKPLKDIPGVLGFFVGLSDKPILCILIGAAFTAVVQSSSASIGMVIAMASVGLIDFTASLYLVLGANIGTTITAWLATIGGSISGKRMACLYTLSKVAEAIYFAPLIHTGIFQRFISFVTPGAVTTETIARHIANAHTCFNALNAVVFLAIMAPAVRFVQFIIPGKDVYVSTDFKYLQDELLATPDIAIESAKKELAAMAEMVHKTITTAAEGFFAKDRRSIAHVQTQENASDHLQHDLTYYLSRLSMQTLTSELAHQLPPLLHSINDLERIADHGVNIAELTDKVVSDNFTFSNKAIAEMRTLYAKTEDMFELTVKTLKHPGSTVSDKIMQIEGEINLLQKEYLAEHSKRLCEQKCSPFSALVFVDFINNLEKIADHLTNIAQASRRDFIFGARNGAEINSA